MSFWCPVFPENYPIQSFRSRQSDPSIYILRCFPPIVARRPCFGSSGKAKPNLALRCTECHCSLIGGTSSANYQANSLLATAGYQLIAQALADFEQATVQEIPQDEGIASYQGFPSESDFTVSNQWTAKRLFNFIRATSEPGRIYPCTVGGHVYPLLKAITYQENGSAKMVATSTTVTIPCAQGYVIARVLAD